MIYLITFIILLFSTILSIYRYKQYSRWQKWMLNEKRNEQSREKFAIARQKLFMLAANGKIDPSSNTYLFFNYLNTLFLRRPEQYTDLSYTLTDSFFSESPTKFKTELGNEKEKLNSEVIEVISLSVDALGFLVFEYSTKMRYLKKLLHLDEPKLTHGGLLAGLKLMIDEQAYSRENEEKGKQLRKDKRKAKLQDLKNKIIGFYNLNADDYLVPRL